MKQPIKKMLALAMSAVVAASAVAASSFATSAVLNPDGTYTPDADTPTYRCYFAMPGAWTNDLTASAGCYWWDGTDAAGSLSDAGGVPVWPGYKACTADEAGVDNLFYMDVPTDVRKIVWNNYLDGGADTTADVFYKSAQTADSPFGSNGYCEDDDTYYDSVPGFWDEINDAFDSGDAEERYGENAGAFYEHPKYGLMMNFNRMIWVVNLDPETHINSELTPGKFTYSGEWYFYYGGGAYGSWPTRALTEEHLGDGATVLGNVTDEAYRDSTAVIPDPVAPASDTIYFDVSSTGWSNFQKVYCYIWQYGEASFYDWGSKQTLMTDEGDGIWSYDLRAHGISFEDEEDYAVIFSNNKGSMTYDLLINNPCIGDTAYCDGMTYESPVDSLKSVLGAFWTAQDPEEYGPVLTVTSIGNVTGMCLRSNVSAYEMMLEFLEYTLENARVFSGESDQALLDRVAGGLDLTADDVEDAIAEADVDVEWSRSKSSLDDGYEESGAELAADYLAEFYDDPDMTGREQVNALLDLYGVTADEVLEELYSRRYSYAKFSAMEKLLAPQQGDVNGDGVVNVVDATEIQKYAAGLPSLLG